MKKSCAPQPSTLVTRTMPLGRISVLVSLGQRAGARPASVEARTSMSASRFELMGTPVTVRTPKLTSVCDANCGESRTSLGTERSIPGSLTMKKSCGPEPLRLVTRTRPLGEISALVNLGQSAGDSPTSVEARTSMPASRFELDEIVIPGPPAVRPVALDAIRLMGVEILGLTAEEGRLDTFYRELIGESA